MTENPWGTPDPNNPASQSHSTPSDPWQAPPPPFTDPTQPAPPAPDPASGPYSGPPAAGPHPGSYPGQPAAGPYPGPYPGQPPYSGGPVPGGQVPPGYPAPQYPGYAYPGDPAAAQGAYANPAYGNPAYGVPAYGLPQFAAAGDPLVSPDYGGWWQRSFSLFGRAWKHMLAVQAAGLGVTLVVLIAGYLLVASRFDNLNYDTANGISPDSADLFGAFLPLIPLFLIYFVATYMVTLTTYQVLIQHATGQQVSIGAAFGIAARRTPALLGWSIVTGLTTALGLIACVLPVFYFAAVFMIVPVVVLLERGGVFSRCFQLFNNDFGAAAGRIATVGGVLVLAAIVEEVLSLIFGISTGLTSGGTVNHAGPQVVGYGISAIINVVSALITTPMILCAYADMRSRREPFSTAYLLPQQLPTY